MTNLPFDDEERSYWERGISRHPAFVAALRLDPLLLEWEKTSRQLQGWGYDVREDLSGQTMAEVRRFFGDWCLRMDSQYCMVSLPPDWTFPANNVTNRLLTEAVLPAAREHGQAFAMMIGVRRGVNPLLRMAGDSLAPADVTSVEAICAAFPQNKFVCTMLARENQHALCVAARKFRNLHIFGCWWFLNNPSLIEEITRMRIELLGLGVTGVGPRLKLRESCVGLACGLARFELGDARAQLRHLRAVRRGRLVRFELGDAGTELLGLGF
jgi:hypothetical protein